MTNHDVDGTEYLKALDLCHTMIVVKGSSFAN